MKKVLLTGGTGFVGSYLAKTLINNGYDVYSIGSPASNAARLNCDLTIKQDVLNLFELIKPDVVIHAAALSSVTRGNTLQYYFQNVVVTENIISGIKQLNNFDTRIIFLSTAGVYGNQEVSVLSEDLTPRPVSHYAYSKYICEMMLKNDCAEYPLTIFRPFNLIGSGQHNDFIVPKLVKHFANFSKTIHLGNIDTERDFIDVQDVCNMIKDSIAAENSYGEVINLCSGVGRSVRTILEILTSMTNHEIKVIVDDKLLRKNEVWKLIGSVNKLNLILPSDVKNITPIVETLHKMLDSANDKDGLVK